MFDLPSSPFPFYPLLLSCVHTNTQILLPHDSLGNNRRVVLRNTLSHMRPLLSPPAHPLVFIDLCVFEWYFASLFTSTTTSYMSLCSHLPCSWGCRSVYAFLPAPKGRWWVWQTGTACPAPPLFSWLWWRYYCLAACCWPRLWERSYSLTKQTHIAGFLKTKWTWVSLYGNSVANAYFYLHVDIWTIQ